MNSTQFTKNKFIVVEFDTKLDPHFADPDDSHVGLDIESLISIKTVNPMPADINFKIGTMITAWVDYNNEEKKLEVFLSYSSFKPEVSLLKVNVDLSDYLDYRAPLWHQE